MDILLLIILTPSQTFYPKLDTSVQFEVTSFNRGYLNGNLFSIPLLDMHPIFNYYFI